MDENGSAENSIQGDIKLTCMNEDSLIFIQFEIEDRGTEGSATAKDSLLKNEGTFSDNSTALMKNDGTAQGRDEKGLTCQQSEDDKSSSSTALQVFKKDEISLLQNEDIGCFDELRVENEEVVLTGSSDRERADCTGSMCSSVEQHETTASVGETTLQCLLCDCSFADEYQLTEHLQRSHIDVESEDTMIHRSYCQKSFLSNADFVKHELERTGGKPFEFSFASEHRSDGHVNGEKTQNGDKEFSLEPLSCSEWDESSMSECDLANHNRVAKKSYKCSHCGIRFLSLKDKKLHEKSHEERPFECHFCEKRFKMKHHLNDHVRLHTWEKLFKCEHCNRKFLHKRSLRHHVGGQECTKCKKKFACMNIKNDHMSNYHGYGQCHECPKCGKYFKSKDNLSRHELRIHISDKKQGHVPMIFDPEFPDGNLPGAHECEYCGKKFTRKGHLTDHIRIHTQEKRFKCKHCGMEFIHRNSFNGHIGKTNGMKPLKCIKCKRKFACMTMKRRHTCHECQKCGKKFKSLSQHSCGIHVKEKSLKELSDKKKVDTSLIVQACRKLPATPECEYCGKKFTNKSHLTEHIRIHTQEKRFKCKHCGMEFIHRNSFIGHIGKTNGMKPLKCIKCKQNFACVTRKKQHMSGYHGYSNKYHEHLECGKKFMSKSNLKQQHEFPSKEISSEHNNNQCDSTKENSAIHECEYCGKTFTRKVHHEEHIKTHTNEKRFECDHCDMRFRVRSSLIPHLGNNALACFKCKEKFACMTMKRIHSCTSQYHDGYAHECTKCGKKFELASGLKQHTCIRVKRKGKAFKCEYCSKEFCYKRWYDMHMASHDTDMPTLSIWSGGSQELTPPPDLSEPPIIFPENG
ncbi:zinc finger protein 420-like [Lytechinus pictus]|uniref:zinc finger protein 420-like n=1 Tax=Lytechinus pictus TaxID=7653 RepID=UPI0030BA277F